uniref:Transposable element Tc3 transposase-like DNA-binding HTH domain-containing protein n=1 Tax=Caenorhabditis japonica TaxID=281687 RepID=A0A8R1EGL5_CAEJA
MFGRSTTDTEIKEASYGPKNRRKGNDFHIGSLNVRSISDQSKAEAFDLLAVNSGCKVIALQETKRKEGEWVLSSGAELICTRREAREGGLAFWIHKDSLDSLVETNRVSDRIITATSGEIWTEEQGVQWTERKASFRDKRNVIRTASNSSKSLNEINAELEIDVCLFLSLSSVTDVAHIHFNKTMLPLTPATSQRTGSRLKESKRSIGRLAARASIRLGTCGKCSFLVFIKIDNNTTIFKSSKLLCNGNDKQATPNESSRINATINKQLRMSAQGDDVYLR